MVKNVDMLSSNAWEDMLAFVPGAWHALLERVESTRRFEAMFADRHGGGYASAFGAGRVALSAILHALEVSAGAEVIIPAYTCVAVPNPVIFSGAVPIYADIDPNTLNLDPMAVANRISSRTAAIVVQHTFGLPQPLEEIRALARRHGVRLIEDCTHALGAVSADGMVGTTSDAAYFSFEQSKVMSTGAGGMTFTRSSDLARRIARFQSRCRCPSASEDLRRLGYVAFLACARGRLPGLTERRLAYYLRRLGLVQPPVTTDQEMHCQLPHDFRVMMGPGLAYLGRFQLARLEGNLSRRRAIAAYYDEHLPSGCGRIVAPEGSLPAYVRYPVRVDDKQRFRDFMGLRGIDVGDWFSAPVHPASVPQAAAKYVVGSCPNAERAVNQVANLPCHPRMSLADAARVVEAARQYFDA